MIAHMPVAYTIRRVQPLLPDAELLAAVEHASLGDSVYTPAQMRAVLERPEHHVYLATNADGAVGFCACFETDAGRRLEVDMLGVLPDWRGRGIARSLIEHALGEARARGARSARGVVAAGNTASRRAFEHAGLSARATTAGVVIHAMLVYAILGLAPQTLPDGWQWETNAPEAAQTPSGGAPERVSLSLSGQVVAEADCLPVQTLCYRGLWVERCEVPPGAAERCMARALAERAKQLELDQVGFLAPQPGPQPALRAAPRMLAWVREGYRDMGDYTVYEVRWP